MSQAAGSARERLVSRAFVSLADTLVDEYDIIELLVTGAGHYPHCDQPQQFLDRLLYFLDHTNPGHRRPADLGARIAAHTTLD